MERFGLNGNQLSRTDIMQMFFRVTIASVITYYTAKWMMSQLDPTSKTKKKAKLRAQDQLKRLSEESDFAITSDKFDDYELMIASNIIVPSDIQSSWDDIAGLDAVIQELRETVIFPISHRHLFRQSKLLHAPRGVLLYGPPGCGKTMIAKATAKEANLRFINLDVSILTDKWYGESQKLASAVFSLALKIQPCLIFIDEIDSFLRSRNMSDHEATAMMKTQFMMLWDGLSTNNQATVVIMGATNRPQDLDKAIVRRMPSQFHIGLPNVHQRMQILKVILESEDIDEDVDLHRLSHQTHGFSGSDLKEMCRNASVLRIRECMRTHFNGEDRNLADESNSFRKRTSLSMKMNDLLRSFEKMQESKMHTGQAYSEGRIDLD